MKDGRALLKTDPEKLAAMGIAGKAWLKQEQRKMEVELMLMPAFELHKPKSIDEASSNRKKSLMEEG